MVCNKCEKKKGDLNHHIRNAVLSIKGAMFQLSKKFTTKDEWICKETIDQQLKRIIDALERFDTGKNCRDER